VDAAHSQWLQEIQWVESLAGQADPSVPQIGAIVAQPPPGFLSVPVSGLMAELDALQMISLVSGVRPNFATAGAPELVTASLDELGRRGIVVDLNIPLANVSALVKASPRTHFVVEHMGGANVTTVDPAVVSAWVAEVTALARLPNIECFQLGGVMRAFKGGAVDRAAVARFVTAAVAEFGWKRTCFEGNWFFNGAPAPTYAQWASALVEILFDAGGTQADLQAVLHDNTVRVYKIKNQSPRL